MCDSQPHSFISLSFPLLCSCSLDATGCMSAPLSDRMDPDPNHLALATQHQTGPPALGDNARPRPGKTKGGEEGKGGGGGGEEKRRVREGGREDRTGQFWASAKLDYILHKLTRSLKRHRYVFSKLIKSHKLF